MPGEKEQYPAQGICFFCAKAEALGRGYQGLINEVLKSAMIEMRREAGAAGCDARL